jgi:D-3-phosphoglycerate dehydrogenase
MVSGFDAIAFAGPGVIPGSFASPDESPLIIARFGVGYDNIDLETCTKAGVALTITPDGSKKPVATAALTLTLATLHRLNAKMNLAKSNNWGSRLDRLGQGLNGKTVGTIGFGNIASEFFRLISPFDCTKLSYDPWKKQSDADPFDVRLVELNELLKECDVVIVLATLTPETKHLLSKPQFEIMKPTSVLINISRGPIVDEIALIDALSTGQIFGAGLDVFETEPTLDGNPLLALDSVVATPHNLAWTDELGSGMGLSAFTSIKKISQGLIPDYVVNKEVLETPQFKEKISKWR